MRRCKCIHNLSITTLIEQTQHNTTTSTRNNHEYFGYFNIFGWLLVKTIIEPLPPIDLSIGAYFNRFVRRQMKGKSRKGWLTTSGSISLPL